MAYMRYRDVPRSDTAGRSIEEEDGHEKRSQQLSSRTFRNHLALGSRWRLVDIHLITRTRSSVEFLGKSPL